jgi:sulfur transfer complex TusBCD TusB component (DsrH family)
MNIGLIDVDSHNFPNLALMKVSAYHKAQGDDVEWCVPLKRYDKVYQSKVFDDTYSPDIDWIPMADEVVKGGTGYGLDNALPYEIEHMYPDYSLYPELTKDTAFGFLSRGCPRQCPFCIVASKEGRKSYKVADLSEWWNGQKNIVLCDPNLLACRDHLELLEQLADSKAWVDMNQGVDARMLTEENIEALNKVKVKTYHFAWDLMEQSDAVLSGLNLFLNHSKVKDRNRRICYVLVNFNTSMEENLYRIYTLWEMGIYPYVMVYDKPNAPKEIRRLQRWCNNRFIFKSCPRFEDYRG